MASGCGWNLWVWLVGVVVRRYIDYLILHIPYSSCICSFLQKHPYFLFIFFNVFRSCKHLVFSVRVHVCVLVCARVCVCVHLCVHVRACTCVYVCLRVLVWYSNPIIV